jgi:hypothetical protein
MRKIKNPIKEGIISKIYTHTFPEAKTGYQIAKGLEYNHINKIYTIIKEYSELFDVIEVDDGNRTKKLLKGKVEPLLKTIKEELAEKKIALTRDEEKVIKKYLETHFRQIVKNLLENKNNTIDIFFDSFIALSALKNFEDLCKRRYGEGYRFDNILHLLSQVSNKLSSGGKCIIDAYKTLREYPELIKKICSEKPPTLMGEVCAALLFMIEVYDYEVVGTMEALSKEKSKTGNHINIRLYK